MNVAASIITIGDELLIGQVIDTNSAWIAQKLNALGIDVLRRVAVGDEAQAITQALDEELSRASLVIMTGGLGPTADDITKPLLCEYFGGRMVVNERVLEHLKDIFTRRNRPFLERNMKQAEVPDICTVLFNRMGTAPGMWFERDGRVIISLPGVPFEMKCIMEEEALPQLHSRFTGGVLLHRSVITAGEGESFIAEKIQDIESALPAHIKLAYLPAAGMVRLRLTGRGADAAPMAAQLDEWRSLIADRLGDIVIAREDVPLEHILWEWFTRHNVTLGVAESCTGGYVGHCITQVPGASHYFRGGIICYDPEIKISALGVSRATLEAEGVVSEATVVEMARGALPALGADYAFAITGLLSGPADRVEPGTVWMAVADRHRVKAKKFRFFYDRAQNKEMAATNGMLMILRFVQGKI